MIRNKDSELGVGIKVLNLDVPLNNNIPLQHQTKTVGAGGGGVGGGESCRGTKIKTVASRTIKIVAISAVLVAAILSAATVTTVYLYLSRQQESRTGPREQPHAVNEHLNIYIVDKDGSLPAQVDIDTGRKIEYVSIPKHGSFQSYENLHDFNQKLTAIKNKEEGVCLVMPLMGPDVAGAVKPTQQRDLIPLTKGETEFFTEAMSARVLSFGVGPSIADFCSGMPTFWAYTNTTAGMQARRDGTVHEVHARTRYKEDTVRSRRKRRKTWPS